MQLKNLEEAKNGAIEELEAEVKEALEGLEQQKQYIKKQRRLTQDFTEEAELAELKYAKDIKKLEELNAELRSKLYAIQKNSQDNTVKCTTSTQTCSVVKDKSIQTELDRQETSVQTESTKISSSTNQQTQTRSDFINLTETNRALEEKLTFLEDQRRGFLTTVDTLTAENECFFNEVSEMKKQIEDLSKDGRGSRNADVATNKSCQEKIATETGIGKTEFNQIEDGHKRKILIVGDESGKNCSTMLYSFLDSSQYKVYGYIMPFASSYEIIDKLVSLTLGYGRADSVIVCLRIKIRTLNPYITRKMFALGKMTNLIMCCKYEENTMLERVYNYVEKYKHRQNNVSIRLIDNLKRYNGFVHNSYTLSKLLTLYIKNGGPPSNNRYVPITADASEQTVAQNNAQGPLNNEIIVSSLNIETTTISIQPISVVDDVENCSNEDTNTNKQNTTTFLQEAQPIIPFL